MGLDLAGHYVPAVTDAPARTAFDKLSRSIRDPFPVATAAARTTLLASLAASSPAVVPSASSPIFFYQQDLPAGYRTLYTVNGSNFIALSGAFVWADAAARGAATGMVAGDFGYQVDTKIEYLYSGSAWVVVPTYCAVRKSTNQNLTTTAAALTWDVEISDPADMHNNSTNTSHLTAPIAGLYEVYTSVYNSNGSGMGTLYARLNGSTDIPGSLDRRTADATSALPLQTSFPVVLAQGNYVEIMVLHSTAAGTIAGGTSQGTAVAIIKRLGPA